MSYIDGFLLAVPKKNLAAYKRMSTKAGKIWMEHGALAYVETMGDDITKKPKVNFPGMVKAKKGEVVVFSWIVYKTRAQRDKVLKKVLADPRLAGMADPATLPFDVKRMAYGGFKAIVEL